MAAPHASALLRRLYARAVALRHEPGKPGVSARRCYDRAQGNHPGVRHAPKGYHEGKYRGGEFLPADASGSSAAGESHDEPFRLSAERPAPDNSRSERRAHGPAPVEFVARHAKAQRERPVASVGTMVAAQRIGTGKEARIVLANGASAPAHIKASHVPPDWTDVTVSTDPNADVLVKARDKAGRIKTVYRDDFHMRTAALKFARAQEMLRKADAIHAQNQANRRSADPAVRDAADLTWLIEQQATRPGSEGDTKAKVKAYGATTLRAEHVVETTEGVRLQFIGKEGVAHDHLIRDPELAKMLLERKRTADARGGKLFQTDDSKLRAYVATLDGGGFIPKDFRTLRANTIAIAEIQRIGECCASPKDYKARVKEVAERVSHVLGNRPSQALESYIDPTLFSVWTQPPPVAKAAKASKPKARSERAQAPEPAHA